MLAMLPILAQAATAVDTLIKTVDQAEKASDRWLFLATVIILVAFFLAVIRFLVKDREATRGEHSAQLKMAYDQVDMARKENTATMKEMYGEQTKLAANLLVAMQENNQLLAELKSILPRK